ncbi:hypothetical protein CHELA41_23110 [Hyphomicrobiales bacterium]|nr:hypothetical protein CHELA41_23110 [Hyphomicrobiales bacterium]
MIEGRLGLSAEFRGCTAAGRGIERWHGTFGDQKEVRADGQGSQWERHINPQKFVVRPGTGARRRINLAQGA